MDIKSIGKTYNPSNQTDGYDTKIAEALDERDCDILEYGLDYHIERTGIDGLLNGKHIVLDDKKQAKEYARSSGWEECDQAIEDSTDKLRRITVWFTNFVDNHGSEEAARETVERVDSFLLEHRAKLEDAKNCQRFLSETLRFENAGGFFEYGLDDELERCERAMGKDLDDMDNINNLKEKIEKLKQFSAHLESKGIDQATIDKWGQYWIGQLEATIKEADSKLGAGEGGGSDEKMELKSIGKVFTPFKNTPGYKSLIKDARDERDRDILEYGLSYHMGRLPIDVFFKRNIVLDDNKQVKEYTRQSDWEKADEKIADCQTKLDNIILWFNNFIDNHGTEEAARETVLEVDEFLHTNQLEFVECKEAQSVLREAYRKERDGGYFDCTLSYYLKQCRWAMEKDMSEQENIDKLNELIEKLSGFRSHLESFIDPSIIDKWGQYIFQDINIVLDESKVHLNGASELVEAKLAAAKAKKEGEEILSKLREELRKAKDWLFRHAAEECMEALHSYKDTRPSLDDYLEVEKVAENYQEMDQAIAQCEADLKVQMKDKIIDASIRTLRSTYNQAAHLEDHWREEEAMDELFKARQNLETLRDPDFEDEQKVQDAIAEYVLKLEDLEVKINNKIIDRAAGEKLRTTRDHMSQAESNLDHYRFEMALESHQKAIEGAAELRANADWAVVEKVAEWLKEFDNRTVDFTVNYNKQMNDRAVSNLLREARDSWSQVEHMFDHSRFEDSLEELAKYKTKIEELTDPQYCQHEDVIPVLDTVDDNIIAFERKYTETVTQRAAEEEVRVANGELDQAKSDFDHSRFEMALEKFNKFKELGQELVDNELYSEYEFKKVLDFSQSFEENCADFEREYTDKVTARAAESAIREVRDEYNIAEGHFDHYRFQMCLTSLNQCKEKCAHLAANDELNPLENVKTFMDEISDKCFDLEQRYTKRINERTLQDAQRRLNDTVSMAKDMLYHHRHEDCLATIQDARDLMTEVNSLVNAGDALSYLDETSTALGALEKEVYESLREKELKEQARILSDLKSQIESDFDHSRFEMALEALQKATEHVELMRLSGNAASVEDFDGWKTGFQKRYTAEVTSRAFEEAKRVANGEINQARDNLDHSRFEMCLESLHKANMLSVQLINDFDAELRPECDAFIMDFNEKADKIRSDYTEIMNQRALDEKRRELNSSMNFADDHLNKSRFEESLESHNIAKSLVSDLEIERDSNVYECKDANSQLSELLDKYSNWESTFLSSYHNAVSSRAVSELRRKLNDHRSQAESHLNHSRFEYAMESTQKSKDDLSQVSDNPLLLESSEVKSVVDEHLDWVPNFEQKISDILLERANEEEQRKVRYNYDLVEGHFDHSRLEHALIALNTTRDLLDSYSTNPDFIDYKDAALFVTEYQEKMITFERKYCERVYANEIKRIQRKCNDLYDRCKDHLSKSRFKSCLESLQQARDTVNTLGTDERFIRSADVANYLNEYHDKLDQVAAEYEQITAQRRADELQRAVRYDFDLAKNDFDHHRHESALANAFKSREKLSDICCEYSGDSKMESFATDISNQLDAFFSEFNERVFTNEVNALIRNANGQFDQANDAFGHHRYEASLEILAKSKEVATQLADAKYNGVNLVDNFFDDWVPKLAAFENKYCETVLGREIDNAIRDCEGFLTTAKNYFDKHCYEHALEYLAKGVEAREAIDANDSYSTVERVAKFSAQFQQDCQAFRVAYNNKVFARECANKIRQVNDAIRNTKRCFDLYQNESALEYFTTCKDLVADLSSSEDFNTMPSIATLISEFKTFSSQFEADYSSRVLAKEASGLIATVRNRLATSKMYKDRHANEKALELLHQARYGDDTSALWDTDSMFKAMPNVIQLDTDVKQAQTEYANEFMIRDANKLVAQVERLLSNDVFAKALSRGQKPEALRLFEAAKEAAADLLGQDSNGELFRSMDNVKALITKLEEMAKQVGSSLYESAASSSGKPGKKKKGSKGPTVEDVLGSRYLKEYPLNKLKLSVTRIGPSVHPKFFSALKQVNQQANNLNRYMKEVFAYLKGRKYMNVEGNMRYHETYLDASDKNNIGYMKRWMKELQDVDSKHELVEKLTAEWEHWQTALEAITKHSNELNKLATQHAQIMWGVNGMKNAVKVLESKKFARFKMGYCDDDNVLGINTFEIMKYNDDESKLGLFAVSIGEKVISFIDRRVEELKSFPAVDSIRARVADLRIRALKAQGRMCIRQITNDRSESRKMWMNIARRFPIARRIMVERVALQEAMNKEVGRNMHIPPTPVNISNQDVKVPDPYEEEESWYWNSSLPIRPGGDDIKMRNLRDFSTSSAYTNFRKENEGKIIFGAEFIDENDSSPSGLKDTFAAGENIYARAFWPRALCNYAIGTDRKSGKPVYGPKVLGGAHTNNYNNWIEFFQFVYIDGKKVEREYQPDGAFSYFRYNGIRRDLNKYKLGSEVDFYAYNQSCRLHIIQQQLEDVSDEWNRAAARYAYHFSKLNSGDHEVKVELCYKYHTSFDNIQDSNVQPDFASFISHPIASGTFTIQIPSSGFPQTPILPRRSPEIKSAGASADSTEKAVLEFMSASREWGSRNRKTEEILAVVQQSDSYITQHDWFEISIGNGEVKLTKEPSEYGYDVIASMYRSPETGWDLEKVACFRLTAAGTRTRNPPQTIPPCTGLYVAGNYTFDAYLLSPEELALIKRRCPENLRFGVKQV